MKTARQLLQNVSSWLGSERPRRKRLPSQNAQWSAMESLEQRLLLVVPPLSSNPGAPVSIYLDFDGEDFSRQDVYVTQTTFLQRLSPVPAFTIDGNPGPNSPVEERLIEEIFERVSEDFRPFTVNVTTIAPPAGVNQIHVAIGGSGAFTHVIQLPNNPMVRNFLFTSPAFAVQGAYTSIPNNPVFVFPQQLQTIDGLNIARTISQGVGFQLGLDTLQVSGNTASGPIMGNPNLNPLRDIWSSGNTASGPQNDIAVITGNGGVYPNAGVRLRADAIPDTIGQAAAALNIIVAAPVGNTVSVAASQIDSKPGLVDSDFYRLTLDFRNTTGSAQLALSLTGLDLSTHVFRSGFVDPTLNPGSNLDLVANLYDVRGFLVSSTDLSPSINGQITYEVPVAAIPGNRIATYYLEVTTTTELGSLGVYTVNGALQEVLGAPVMLAPTGIVTTVGPQYMWTTSLQATSYQLQVENVATGAIIVNETASLTTYVAKKGLTEGDFRVRVKAIRGAGGINNESVWSDYLPFSVDVPVPGVPQISGPLGDITDAFPTFVWTGDSVTNNYSLWVNDVTNPRAVTRVLYRTAHTGTSYVHFEPLKDATYRAWVRAFNSVGEFSSWSIPVTFTIDSPDVVAPQISAPVVLSTNETPRIIWNAVDGAARYDLWVNNLTTGTSQVIRKSNISRLTPFFDTPALPQGSYRAWVRAASGNGEFSDWSSAYTFTIDVARPAAPRITAPNAGAANITITNANPTFTWDPAVRAVKYDLWVNNVTTGQTQIIRQQNIVGTSYVALNPLPQGNYRAWVRGINSADEVGNWSTVSIFTIDEPTPSLPTIVEPKSNPAGSVENPNPTFIWTSDFDAPFYEFRLDDQTLNKTGVISVKNLTEKMYTIPNDKRLAEHTYLAFVRGVNNVGEMSNWSPAFRVRIDVPNPTTPTIIGPKLTSNDTTPTFEWTLDPGSFRFEILVRDLERNETIVLQVRQYSVNASDPTNKIAFYTLPDNMAFKPSTYRFWIRAFNALGTSSSWSASQAFVISASLDLKDLKIVEPARMQAAEDFYADATFYTDSEELTVNSAPEAVMHGGAVAALPAMEEASMPVAMIEELMASLADPSSTTAAMLSGVVYDESALQSGSDKTTVAAASILALAMMPKRRKRRDE